MSNEVEMRDLNDGRGPTPRYKHSWNCYHGFDEKGHGHWYRVPPDDPRGTHQLCVAGSGIDPNFPPSAFDTQFPMAPELTAELRAAAEKANAAFFAGTWIDQRGPIYRDK